MNDNKNIVSERAAPRRRSKSLTQEVVAELTRQIESGMLKVGEKLPTESELIEQQGVSRTVIREAISHLQASGLIETRHGIGSFVLDHQHVPNFRIDTSMLVTIHDILDVLELRQSLESAAAGIAAQKRDEQDVQHLQALLDEFQSSLELGLDTADVDFRFHLAIAKATKNRYFMEFMSYLGQTVIPRTRMKIEQNDREVLRRYLERVHQEHQEILNAIESGNPLLASSAMQMHLNNSAQRLRSSLQKS